MACEHVGLLKTEIIFFASNYIFSSNYSYLITVCKQSYISINYSYLMLIIYKLFYSFEELFLSNTKNLYAIIGFQVTIPIK